MLFVPPPPAASPDISSGNLTPAAADGTTRKHPGLFAAALQTALPAPVNETKASDQPPCLASNTQISPNPSPKTQTKSLLVAMSEAVTGNESAMDAVDSNKTDDRSDTRILHSGLLPSSKSKSKRAAARVFADAVSEGHKIAATPSASLVVPVTNVVSFSESAASDSSLHAALPVTGDEFPQQEPIATSGLESHLMTSGSDRAAIKLPAGFKSSYTPQPSWDQNVQASIDNIKQLRPVGPSGSGTVVHGTVKPPRRGILVTGRVNLSGAAPLTLRTSIPFSRFTVSPINQSAVLQNPSVAQSAIITSSESGAQTSQAIGLTTADKSGGTPSQTSYMFDVPVDLTRLAASHPQTVVVSSAGSPRLGNKSSSAIDNTAVRFSRIRRTQTGLLPFASKKPESEAVDITTNNDTGSDLAGGGVTTSIEEPELIAANSDPIGSAIFQSGTQSPMTVLDLASSARFLHGPAGLLDSGGQANPSHPTPNSTSGLVNRGLPGSVSTNGTVHYVRTESAQQIDLKNVYAKPDNLLGLNPKHSSTLDVETNVSTDRNSELNRSSAENGNDVHVPIFAVAHSDSQFVPSVKTSSSNSLSKSDGERAAKQVQSVLSTMQGVVTKSGPAEVSIHLHPHDWGHVTIKVETVTAPNGTSVLKAHITAETDGIKNALQQHVSELKDALKSSGITVDDVAISVQVVHPGQAAASANSQPFGSHDHGQSGQWAAQNSSNGGAQSQAGHFGSEHPSGTQRDTPQDQYTSRMNDSDDEFDDAIASVLSQVDLRA